MPNAAQFHQGISATTQVIRTQVMSQAGSLITQVIL